MISFGTDGIRGKYGIDFSDAEAYKIGVALTRLKRRPLVAIGGDTRVSTESLVSAASFGVSAGGGTPILLGVTTTPKLIYLTKLLQCDYGIEITASHNGKEYNGIKIVDSRGYKLSREEADLIVSIAAYLKGEMPKTTEKAVYSDSLQNYEEYLIKETQIKNPLKVGFDLCCGAAVKAKRTLQNIANLTPYFIGDEEDGSKINDGIGALYPENIKKLVLENNLGCGFAFDGDGDRIIAVSKSGEIIDGDGILLALSCGKNGVVGTRQSNSGLEYELKRRGIPFYRSDVGDHLVADMMVRLNVDLGGEPSGHIIIGNSNAGDGVLAALKLLSLEDSIEKACAFRRFPLFTADVESGNPKIIAAMDSVKRAVEMVNERFGETGRAFVRASGTENKVRIFVECVNYDEAKNAAEYLTKEIIKVCAE